MILIIVHSINKFELVNMIGRLLPLVNHWQSHANDLLSVKLSEGLSGRILGI